MGGEVPAGKRLQLVIIGVRDEDVLDHPKDHGHGGGDKDDPYPIQLYVNPDFFKHFKSPVGGLIIKYNVKFKINISVKDSQMALLKLDGKNKLW